MSLKNLASDIEQRVKNHLNMSDQELLASVSRVCFLSEFFINLVENQTPLMQELIDSSDLEHSYDLKDWERIFKNVGTRHQTTTNESANTKPVADEDRESLVTIETALRLVRKRELARIIYRDLTRLSDLTETTSDLSSLADFSVQCALEHFYDALCQELGTPVGYNTKSNQQMVVLGLGKLGARELNLSSDIDLVFMYDESGWLDDDEGKLSNQEFFVRLSRKIIHCLSNVSSDGFVFRVDMRLRPYGESSALILNRSAMEQYYLQQGRDWERYAFIKARAVAGNLDLGREFLQWLKPFVFRKHLDYGAIESLRQMKEMINREVRQRNLEDDLKLGPGGIREIEFVVQANQLIWGGKDPSLQDARLLHNLEVMSNNGYLPPEDKVILEEAYIFLRNSEHAVQAEKDQQTHKLPIEEVSRVRLAGSMGFDDWTSYLLALENHRSMVMDCFARIVTSGESEREDLLEGNLHWQVIWRASENEKNLTSLLGNTSFNDVNSFSLAIESLKKELTRGDKSDQGAERLDKLMPILLGFVAEQQEPEIVLSRVLPIVHAILRRSTYILFLLENMDALKRMVFLCGMSQWLAEQLKDYPVLLYEFTDKQIHEAQFEKDLLLKELLQLTDALEEDDLESEMDVMRQFKKRWVLKVAVYELLGSLPVMEASDALTDIAEIILAKAIEISWRHMAKRHGVPQSHNQGADVPGLKSEGLGVTKFGVIAYGKLGGFELGYQSDLDLVFIHDHDIQVDTNGPKPVNVNTFFVRLGQRLVHILSSHTRFGDLYKVDLRLRPSGNKGPLVATMSAFERYQEQDAWTWEHQALVRARFVAGDDEIRDKFQDIRAKILTRKRDQSVLLQEVVSMREKMRAHLSSKSKKPFDQKEEGADILVSGFDLKHGVGAIVDIEFMVQYVVLAWSHKYTELVTWTDKMRILDELGKLGLFTQKDTSILQEAYLAYRAAVHYQSLGGKMESYKSLEALRHDVSEIWQQNMLEMD